MTRRHAVSLFAVLLLARGGCTVTTDGSPVSSSPRSAGSTGASVDPGSLVRDGKAVLDFRTRPTRTSVGMPEDGFISYPLGTGAPPVHATLFFPRGTVHGTFFETVHGTFFEMDIGVDQGFGADPDPAHAPKYFDLFQRLPDIAAVHALLLRDANALGLSKAALGEVTDESTSVLPVYVHDWFSVYVQVRSRDHGSYNVIYSVGIDQYHNEAVDRVVRDGALTVDLRSRPSRADLGFLPSYNSATIQPEPNQTYELHLVTASGTATMPITSLMSEAKDSSVTYAGLGVETSQDRAVAALRSAAGPLGFDEAAVLDFVQHPTGDYGRRTFACADTAVYTCALKVGTSTVDGPDDQVSISLTFTFR